MKNFGSKFVAALLILLILLLVRVNSRQERSEILGWYCIDWGSDYYAQDFAEIKNLYIDGVILRSFEHYFPSNPGAFMVAIDEARKIGLKVGVSIFHPSHGDLLKVWKLPTDHSFADFTTNKTWIETVYADKLRDLVHVGDLLNLVYYAFDDMAFGRVSNVTNAQLFIDMTFSITHGKALMLAHYPPKRSTVLNLSIPSWEWYVAPEDTYNLFQSTKQTPMNSTSFGHFIFLHERTNITFSELRVAYDLLSDSDRIQIFPLRYGGPAWTKGTANSILEHPSLIECIRELNLRYISLQHCEASRLSSNQPHR